MKNLTKEDLDYYVQLIHEINNEELSLEVKKVVIGGVLKMMLEGITKQQFFNKLKKYLNYE